MNNVYLMQFFSNNKSQLTIGVSTTPLLLLEQRESSITLNM